MQTTSFWNSSGLTVPILQFQLGTETWCSYYFGLSHLLAGAIHHLLAFAIHLLQAGPHYLWLAGELSANSIPVQAAFPSMTGATLPTSAFGGQQFSGTASGFLSFSLGPKLVFLLVGQLHLLTWAIQQLLAGALRPAVPTPVFILLLRSHSPSPLIRLPSQHLLVDLGQL